MPTIRSFARLEYESQEVDVGTVAMNLASLSLSVSMLLYM